MRRYSQVLSCSAVLLLFSISASAQFPVEPLVDPHWMELSLAQRQALRRPYETWAGRANALLSQSGRIDAAAAAELMLSAPSDAVRAQLAARLDDQALQRSVDALADNASFSGRRVAGMLHNELAQRAEEPAASLHEANALVARLGYASDVEELVRAAAALADRPDASTEAKRIARGVLETIQGVVTADAILQAHDNFYVAFKAVNLPVVLAIHDSVRDHYSDERLEGILLSAGEASGGESVGNYLLYFLADQARHTTDFEKLDWCIQRAHRHAQESADPEATELLGAIYTFRGLASLQRNALDRAEADFLQAAALDIPVERLSLAYFYAGRARIQRGDIEGAIVLFEQGITFEGESDQWHWMVEDLQSLKKRSED